MFHLFDHELDSIGSSSLQSSIHLAFFGAALSAAISLWVTIATVEMKSANLYAAFWSVAVVSSVMSVYFGIRARRDYLAAKYQIEQIKANSEREIQDRTSGEIH